MPNIDPDGRIFLSAPNNHDRVSFLHIFGSPAFDFNVGVVINETRSCLLMSAILNFEVVSSCDIAMMSSPNFLTTELRDVLYNPCIDKRVVIRFFIYPTGRIRVRKIRFVSTGENRGKPCLVCKKSISYIHILNISHWQNPNKPRNNGRITWMIHQTGSGIYCRGNSHLTCFLNKSILPCLCALDLCYSMSITN